MKKVLRVIDIVTRIIAVLFLGYVASALFLTFGAAQLCEHGIRLTPIYKLTCLAP